MNDTEDRTDASDATPETADAKVAGSRTRLLLFFLFSSCATLPPPAMPTQPGWRWTETGWQRDLTEQL